MRLNVLIAAIFAVSCSSTGGKTVLGSEFEIEGVSTATGDRVITYGVSPLRQADRLCYTQVRSEVQARNGETESLASESGQIAVFHEAPSKWGCPKKLHSSFFLSTEGSLASLPKATLRVRQLVSGKRVGSLCPQLRGNFAAGLVSYSDLYSLIEERGKVLAELRVETTDGSVIGIDLLLNDGSTVSTSAPVVNCSNIE